MDFDADLLRAFVSSRLLSPSFVVTPGRTISRTNWCARQTSKPAGRINRSSRGDRRLSGPPAMVLLAVMAIDNHPNTFRHLVESSQSVHRVQQLTLLIVVG